MSSGLVANFGTMTKSFQVGRAAQSGAIAARLAQAGFTASLDALEHPSGLLAALSPDGRADRERSFDPARKCSHIKSWHIVAEGLNIKRYPICYATHRCIDAALSIVERHDLQPQAVERIDVSIGETQLRMLRNSRPQSGLEAKFSMQFAMASTLVARQVGLAQLTDGFVRRSDVQALLPRVSFTTTAQTMPGSAFAPADSVTITTSNGETHNSGPVEFAKGSHQHPLSQEELFVKFRDCLGTGYAEAHKLQAFEKLMIFDQLNGAGDLALGG